MEDVSQRVRLHLLRGHLHGNLIQDRTYGQGIGRGLFRRESDESSCCQDHDEGRKEEDSKIREDLALNQAFHSIEIVVKEDRISLVHQRSLKSPPPAEGLPQKINYESLTLPQKSLRRLLAG
jgi:hypothetical protein